MEAVELYRKYRPTTFKEVVGQAEAVKVLEDMLRRKVVPHALLFTGPSGCGKTTLARIMVSKLKCGSMDFREVNAADFRGVEVVRDIRQHMGLAAASGATRVWLIDEAHKLTSDAQSAFLKMLEDTPDHVYFMLATTDPQKLLGTIKTRCTEVRVKAVDAVGLISMMGDILHAEYPDNEEDPVVTNDVLERIAECADGSPRKALVLLHSVLGLGSEEEQLAALLSNEAKQQVYDLCRALMGGHARWPEVAKILSGIEEEPESVRWMVMGYMQKIALAGGKGSTRAIEILKAFQYNYFDTKKAGLILSCAQVLGV